MSMYKNLLKLKPSDQTLFTTSEIAQILNINNKPKLYSFLKYSSANGDLTRITRGIYSISKDFSKLELGNKLRLPSYLSLYTILQKNGVIFQNYESIYLSSNRSDTVTINNNEFIYKKIKDSILFDNTGLMVENNTTLATSERAICDLIYLGFDYYFDNLRQIDFELISNLNDKLYKNNKINKFLKKNN
jgi:predicted transcriptional regulator of viral defense system